MQNKQNATSVLSISQRVVSLLCTGLCEGPAYACSVYYICSTSNAVFLQPTIGTGLVPGSLICFLSQHQNRVNGRVAQSLRVRNISVLRQNFLTIVSGIGAITGPTDEALAQLSDKA